MKILVLSVGKPKNPLFIKQVEDYRQRVSVRLPCKWDVVRESSGRKPQNIILLEEGNALLKKVGERDYFVLLDESGRTMTSVRFSEWLFRRISETPGKTVMAVGGAFGVSAEVRERANETMSLSPMTLTHEMSLLFLFEQIYRAVTIEKGGNYHHGNVVR
ncbi:MAG TPA: 23S rRNA (pseudouridine(1915)-N(3))-methyltransferase RlmH [Synergistales bacterium]|nr:23S rRNA (pseudouridine(1915)-N(3))-methyltransferase RlmH [Synergistales bacterium]HRV70848.1 23S rRNA (pseudouridine(1915)-N(3))-methyltransferase RlmH [Thermovirgaceae bacterium]